MNSTIPLCKLSPEHISRLENKILIDGVLTSPVSVSTFPVIHSARGIEVCQQVDCNAEDVERAVHSAALSQKEWARQSPRQRGSLLRKGLRRLEEAKGELAQFLTLETSKALRTESELDVQAAIDILDFYSGLGSELKGETLPYRENVLAFTVRQPIGVVGAILPWNVPLMLMALKIGPALMAGNSVVVKSSEFAPLSVLRMAELLNQDLPPGVLNVISGHGSPTGQALVDHPQVGKVTFTGSVATGRSIYQNSAKRLIPVTLELGGKSPMVICEDADVTLAAQGAVQGMRFTRQGQSCSASSRIYVHEKIRDRFLELVGQKLNSLVIGDPFDPKVDAGAVACRMQYDKILSFLNNVEKSKVSQFNQLPTQADLSAGLFLRPTLLMDPDEQSAVVKEEIFGPVACVFRWKTLDEVIRRANETRFGLAATAWTRDLNVAMRLTDELDAGFVQVNQNLVVQATLTYGGFKNSGLGKEASLGAMLEHFTRSKTVLISKGQP